MWQLLSSDQELVAAPTVSGYSWADLQLAMGASDEEMAMLEQLGEHSLQVSSLRNRTKLCIINVNKYLYEFYQYLFKLFQMPGKYSVNGKAFRGKQL